MDGIRREVVYPHPPERVWRALTDPDVLASWLMPNDIDPQVGHRFTFRTKPAPGFDGIVRCEVLEADPPHRLVYTWAGGPTKAKPTTVAWTLSRVEGGTRLTLEHTGFSGLGGFFLKAMLGRGWGHKLREPQHFAAVLARLAGGAD
jgi:uncharacterized protein YndB with AHSA1/START domain